MFKLCKYFFLLNRCESGDLSEFGSLSLNWPNMNQNIQLTLRIRTEQDQDIDWMVHPDEITFHQAMVYFNFLIYFNK